MKNNSNPMEFYLKKYPPKNVKKNDHEGNFAAREQKIHGVSIKQSLDVHGLSKEEAIYDLHSFLERAYHHHWDKVLIIHGKGLHSPDQKAVLKTVVIEELNKHPRVRRYGLASPKDGGSGATWAIIRL